MPTYYLAGLMYINGCRGDDRRVLIPDGSKDPEIQPPLDATLLVAKDDWRADTFGTAWRTGTIWTRWPADCAGPPRHSVEKSAKGALVECFFSRTHQATPSNCSSSRTRIDGSGNDQLSDPAVTWRGSRHTQYGGADVMPAQ